jgi:hypothetical protein
MQLVNDRRGFWKAFWKSDGISGKKPEVDDPTLDPRTLEHRQPKKIEKKKFTENFSLF